ncbi:MAG: zinc ribbon domain-containing protein [Bryobacteraceae bacterium]
MFCAQCGHSIPDHAGFCIGCGTAVRKAPQTDRPHSQTSLLSYGILGLLVGAIIGYLTRPSIPILGRQPTLDIVLTGGSNLHGINRVLAPLAQQAQHQVITYACIGAVIMVFVGVLANRAGQR